MPTAGCRSAASARGNLDRLRARAKRAAARVEDITLALFGAPTDARELHGRIDQGFDELIFSLPSETADKILPKLDRIASIVSRGERTVRSRSPDRDGSSSIALERALLRHTIYACRSISLGRALPHEACGSGRPTAILHPSTSFAS